MADRSAPVPRTANKYWLIANKSSGHALVSFGNNPTSPAILKALGAKSPGEVQTYGWSGNFTSGIFAGIGRFNLSIDTIPTAFKPARGTDIMGLNFDPGLGTGKLPGAPAKTPGNPTPSGIGGGPLGGVADAISSSTDFLKFIAWIFHPKNVLRAVEFVVGFILMIFGLHAAMQARGERVEGFSTSEGALTRSGLGRVATELGRAARAPAGSRRPQRPRSAPHRTRQKALAQRYRREEDLQRRRAKAPRPKKKP